jgi:hypothetical protein
MIPTPRQVLNCHGSAVEQATERPAWRAASHGLRRHRDVVTVLAGCFRPVISDP